MTKIIGIGNALTDILVHLPDERLLHELHLEKGGMFHVGEREMLALHAAIAPYHPVRATGGSAANTIHALSAIGNPVGFVGSIGNDERGQFFARRQQERHIDTRLHVCKDRISGVATTLITPDGERTFATHLGAAPNICIEDLKTMFDESCQKSADRHPSYVLHVEGYLVQNHAFVEQVMRLAKQAGVPVSYDLASWNIVQNDHEFVQHLVQEYVDIAFANEEEATAFSQTDDPMCSLDLLSTMTQTAVVKLGKHGACAKTGNQSFTTPGLKEKPVDTTAAGDFFAAGFLHGWIHGEAPDTCLDYGNRLANEVIQVLGTQVSDERLQQALHESHLCIYNNI